MYGVQLSDQAAEFLTILDVKSKKICKKNLQKMEQLYPGRGLGDKEKLVIQGQELYRLHIGRTFTAFYVILEKQKLVRVLELLTIEAAHKKYGYRK